MDVLKNDGSHYIEQLLCSIYKEPREVVEIIKQSGGQQGFSGSLIEYYSVNHCDQQGKMQKDVIVTKEAVLFERRVLHLLSSYGCAVPPLIIPDITKDQRDLIYMPYLNDCPPLDHGHHDSPLTHSIAEGLAGIHSASLNKHPIWMRKTSDDYLGRLWLYEWKKQWEINLQDSEFVREFGSYTHRLETAMEQFIHTLEELRREGNTLTILNVDLHPDHIRLFQGKACFIDWEQASYGTLYLDLPNHFNVETVLVYRDALARCGHEIPVPEFMERFHEVGRYMGLRYLGVSLWQWAQGGEQRRQGRWFLYYTLHLALHGR
jgi:hypothetical protein